MKVCIRVIAILLVAVSLFVINDHLTVDRYSETVMYGSFEQKRARAESVEGEKFIVIGGSASNLGFDSQLFEELAGKPAVNLSVSAGVPLRVYMRAAELCAGEGDVILFPMEYGYYKDEFDKLSEDYVDIVAVDGDLQCDQGIANRIDYAASRFLRSYTRINDCLLFAIRSKMGTANTIYVADSVNEYGDFCLHKDREPTYLCAPRDDLFEYNKDTMEEIACFIEKMAEKGVQVYLTYPCVDKYNFEDYERYFADAQKAVETYISAENIVGTPTDFAYESDFFFDTAYHLRYEKRAIYTQHVFEQYQKKAE